MHWWEEEVRLQTQDLWYNAGAAVQVARAAGEVIVVFKKIGSLLVFVCGRVRKHYMIIVPHSMQLSDCNCSITCVCFAYNRMIMTS
jgi:hypothetical protein